MSYELGYCISKQNFNCKLINFKANIEIGKFNKSTFETYFVLIKKD